MSIGVGVTLAAGTFWRRPNLSLHEERSESRVERDSEGGGIPSVRLIARNGRLHRASRGTRVLVEGYERIGESGFTSLAAVPLGWTSGVDESTAAVIFPDGERSVDLGIMQVQYDENGRGQRWAFSIAPLVRPYEGRSVLAPRPQGYVIRVVIGSDDGRARRYGIHLNWDGDMRIVDGTWNVDGVLDSVQLSVTRIR